MTVIIDEAEFSNLGIKAIPISEDYPSKFDRLLCGGIWCIVQLEYEYIEEVYKFSPYKLLWCGDYYYVLGYSEKKSKVINFRVDRIASKPEILDKDIIPMPDDFDIENYTKEVFFMFSGEKVLVDLRCDNSLMKTMVDRFGEDVTTLAYDMTSFRVQTEVSASPTFFGWVFGFNGKVQILAPESVKEQYRQMIAKADEDMQESE